MTIVVKVCSIFTAVYFCKAFSSCFPKLSFGLEIALLQYFVKVFSEDHPAEFDAALVLWALKVEVYMPASFSSCFNHLPTVSLETGPCGF